MHEEFMREALALALEARAAGEVPVGAIVVMGDESWARPQLPDWANDPTAHAEMLALREACGRIGIIGCRARLCTRRWSLASCAPERWWRPAWRSWCSATRDLRFGGVRASSS